MPHPVVASYKVLLPLLQQQLLMPPATQSEQARLGQVLQKHIDDMLTLLPWPRSVWKVIVRDLEVPRKLSALCAQLELSANPRAAYAVAQSWRILCVLLDAAIHDKVLGDHTFLALAAADKQLSLASSMTQQVQQAGLFDQCPKTLRTATQLLQASTNAIVASRGSSSSSNRAGSSAPEPVLISTCEFLSACTMLLLTGYQLTVLQAPSSPTFDATIDAVADLAHTAMQFLSVLFALDGACTENGLGQAIWQQLAKESQQAVFKVCRLIQPGSTSQKLATSGSISSAVSLGVMLLHARSLLPQSLQAPGGHSGGNGGSSKSAARGGFRRGKSQNSSTSSTSADSLQRMWKAVHKLEQRQLPATHQRMLCCLGVSMRAMACAAAHSDGTLDTLFGNLHAVGTAGQALTKAQEQLQQQQWQQWYGGGPTSMPAHAGLPHQDDPTDLAQIGLQIEEQFGGSLLLLSLAQQQKERLGMDWVATVVDVSAAATNAASGAHFTHAGQWLGCRAGSQRLLDLEVWSRTMQEKYARWVADTLPVVLQLLTGLLQEADKISQQQCLAAAATGGGSSSGCAVGPSSAASAAAAAVPAAAEDAALCVESLQNLLLLLSVLARDFSPPVGLDSSPFLQHADAWVDHSTELSVALDGVWRVHCRLGVFESKLGQSIQLRGIMGPTSPEAPLLLAAVAAGPGSPQQVQLFSMLCSLFKLCCAYRGLDAEHADRCVATVIACAAEVLLQSGCQRSIDEVQEPTATQLPCEAAQATAQAAAGTAAAAAAAPQAGSAVDPVGCLPWLVLLGRCFMHWADQLQQLQQGKPDFGQLLLQAQAASTGTVRAGGAPVPGGNRERVGAVFGVHGSHAVGLVVGNEELRLCTVGACQSWLAIAEWVDRLAAEGYPMQGIVQQTDAAVDALKVFAAVPDGDPAAATAAYGEVVRQLHQLGCVLTTLAVPHACNNPTCSNMAGDTEVAAVSGRSCMCAGCLTARYCSRVCQKQHWKQHKPVCKTLAAAAAATQQ